MSTFKTQAEMSAALEFIQYLEQVKSGSLAGNQGINRSLERLSLSLDAVLEALQSAKMSFLEGGGDISFSANTLTWTSDLTIYFPGELNLVRSNVIPAASLSGLSNGKVIYVVLDRATEGATLTPVVAASLIAFLAVIAGQPDRLDYLILARATSDGLTFFDGRRIVEGYALASEGYVDTQYGQQTELTLVHDNEIENKEIFLTGGGNISWDLSAAEFSWTAALVFEFPSSPGNNRILVASSPMVIPAGYVMYVTLSRSPVGIVNLTPATALSGTLSASDDIFIVAFHKVSDGRLYLRNGQSLVDGETTRLGAVRTGVQWMYKQPGSGVQVTDFTESGAFPSRSYRVGSNELMVYRNGIKARVSDAYWLGAYPLGVLVGSISADDHYLEEADAVGTGNRILWLADDGSSEGHPVATHDPDWTWPDAADYIEAFIGIHGDAPSPVDGVGIHPEPGGGPIEGTVKLKAGANVSLAYDFPNNAITIGASISAGVTSLELFGGSGPKTGALALVESTTVDIAEVGPSQFKFDVKSPYSLGLQAATTPSAANPYATYSDFDFMSGFDVVWGTDGTSKKIYTIGGVLRSGGVSYPSRSYTERVEFSGANVFPSDTLLLNGWNYAYLYPGISPNVKPRGVLSSLPPAAAGTGKHPSNSTYIFLSSVYVNASSEVKPFVKRGSFVELGFERAITSQFSGVVWAGTGTYSTVTLEDPAIPASGVREIEVELQLNVDTGALAVGDRVEVRVRVPGYTDYRSYYASRGNPSTVFLNLVLPIDPNNEVEISGSAEILSVSSATLTGYVEGRFTAADGMGA